MASEFPEDLDARIMAANALKQNIIAQAKHILEDVAAVDEILAGLPSAFEHKGKIYGIHWHDLCKLTGLSECKALKVLTDGS